MQLAIAPAAFAQSLATARDAQNRAAQALSKALHHVRPITPEAHELYLTRPEAYAEMLRKLAEIVATLPELREQAKTTLDAVSELEERACFDCNGTGSYWGPTNATRRGHAYCFRCNGTGEKGRRA